MSEVETAELRRLVASLREFLAFQQRQGLKIVAAPAVTPSAGQPQARTQTVTLEPPVPSRPTLADIRAELGDCRRCKLWRLRTQIVFGVGNPQAELMLIGEAPGAEEDRQGEPFVGAAGQLLTRLLTKLGLQRQEVYIANIIKCRPPRNRDPEPDEVAACLPFLIKQIEAIQPLIIVTLGRIALQNLLAAKIPLGQVRGKWQQWRGIPVMPTFHPSYLLRAPQERIKTWEDMQAVMAKWRELKQQPGPRGGGAA